ncbi:MAG: hypothetical protein HYY16_14005 [Planctomycetes bacterium]|nr:hypothetical protein [Planctomycetota bacterium]
MSDDFVQFTPEMNILEALMLGPEVREAFRRMGLKCVAAKDRGVQTEYCIAAEKEPLSLAGLYHEHDLKAVLNALNALKVRPLTDEEKTRGGR